MAFNLLSNSHLDEHLSQGWTIVLLLLAVSRSRLGVFSISVAVEILVWAKSLGVSECRDGKTGKWSKLLKFFDWLVDLGLECTNPP